jgi:WD40 repeat protein
MTQARASIPSVAERTRPIRPDASVVAAHFLGDSAVLVLAEENLLLVSPGKEPRSVAIHAGAILSSAADGTHVITGGDDGKVMITGTDGTSGEFAVDEKRRWIDHVAVGAASAVAWSAGREAHVRIDGRSERVLDAPSTVGGLAFAPKGLRLAVAHYNGVALWFPNTETEPQTLSWKGSHLDVVFSCDGKFLVSCMQEPVLHGWRLADGTDMRMSGYGTRVRSLAWTAGGKWLATSGAPQLVLWPFQGKDGPMHSQPRMLARAACDIEVVACHPRQDIVAAGYADGLVLLIRIDDGAEVLARKGAGAPITALAWSAAGDELAFGTEDGEAGIIALG